MRIGVDLGGTKIEAIALGDNGRSLARQRVPSPQGDYSRTIAAIVALVGELEGRLGCRGSVGVGIPGTISPASGLVKNANSAWIIGRPLDRDLAAALGRPVRIENDANCFALSEALDGAGTGAGTGARTGAGAADGVVFGVILGTGVGGGVVIGGRCLRGRNAIAGEWGHNPLPWPGDEERPGPRCYCGMEGCIEVFLSGPGLTRDHRNAGGKALSPEAIAAQAAEGQAAAMATMARYEDRLSRALASVINLLDPDVIVLGGGLSKIDRLYRAVPERLGAYVFSDRVDTSIVPPHHGDSSGVRGAAWLWRLDEMDLALGGPGA